MTEPEIELMKRRIEAELKEYEDAIKAAKLWMAGWRKRQKQRGFRCVEDQKAI